MLNSMAFLYSLVTNDLRCKTDGYGAQPPHTNSSLNPVHAFAKALACNAHIPRQAKGQAYTTYWYSEEEIP
jgi:hypothetical protein